MGIEDYFPYLSCEDRSPLTISFEEADINGEKRYKLVLTDREGVVVRDATALTAEQFNARLESRGEGKKRVIGLVEKLTKDRNYKFSNPDFRIS